MKFRLVLLGTGTSQGVPVIGCDCVVCQSNDPKDNRLRTSALVKTKSGNILIDIGPDFRTQMLKSKNNSIHSILLTHQHRDHTAGLDDIRPIYYLNKKPIDLYAEDHVCKAIKSDFNYLFDDNEYPGKPKINVSIINDKPFDILNASITPIRVMHHKLPVLGYRIGGMSYITDANYISLDEKKKIIGSKILILNSLQRKPHVSHYNLEQSLALIEELKPEKAYLTHISHEMGMHDSLTQELPKNVFLAYDNLEISF